MGMYDEIRCDYPLPTQPPSFVEDGHWYQTKCLECQLSRYVITADGGLAPHATMEPDKDFHGTINFYTSNWAGFFGKQAYTSNGEPYEEVEYCAYFCYGKLDKIVEVVRCVEPAKHIREMRSDAERSRATSQPPPEARGESTG